MADAPSAQALTALAVVMSLLESLLKRGAIDQTAMDIIVRSAGTYAQALCADCSTEVEREVQQLLAVFGKTATAGSETAPIPLVDPA
jgi:hypothetical protein